MKILKRLSLLFILTIVGLTSLSISTSNVKADGGQLFVHYFRYDNDFTGWNLWMWPENGDSAAYNFTGTDEYGAYVSVPLSTFSSTRVGVIVRLGEWTKKDPDCDRFIDISQPDSSGNVHAYLVTGSKEIYYNREDVDTSHKILSAYFDDISLIRFSTTAQTASLISSFEVYEGDTVIASAYTSFSNGNGTVRLNKNADLKKQYKLKMTIDGTPTEATITYDGIYSSKEFNDEYYYDGNDLGAVYSKGSTTFKVWAPISTKVQLCLYTKGHDTSVRSDGVDDPYDTKDMVKGEKGVWSVTVNGDLDSICYTYKVTNGSNISEVVDPYAKSTGVNGKRGMVVNFNSDKTMPENWNSKSKPAFSGNYVDAIIYELHIRDLTTHASWKGTEAYRGTFMGAAEKGTTYTRQGVTVSTGLDHIIELGVTHVQILPIEEFPFVDETRLNDEDYKNQAHDGLFNWGYMTDNYNVIEGSYCTDPYDGNVRIKEYKTMIKAFHDNGLRINMDVVYNHSAKSGDSNFNLIVPGYYHRMVNGSYSNGSGCGNETASEHLMMRKFMVDSIKFWTEEYGIDGYRFDLMSLHDYETMNKIYEEAAKIEPGVMVYGEPWTGGGSALDGSLMATKSTMNKMPNVGSFCDYSRDGYKGTGQDFEASKNGFLYDASNKNGVKFGITGGAIGGSEYTYTSPNQQINYIECHDNWTLFDKVAYYYVAGNKVETFPSLTEKQTKNLAPKCVSAGALLLTSQGISFLDSGVEMLRTKRGDGNSYNASDAVNQLNYSRKAQYLDVFEQYKTLIALRKAHPSLRMTSHEDINNNLTFLDSKSDRFIAYNIKSTTDEWADYIVAHNTTKDTLVVNIESGEYTPVYSSVADTTNVVGTKTQYNGSLTLQPNESVIIVKTFNEKIDNPVPPVAPAGGCGCSSTTVSIEGATSIATLFGIGSIFFFVLKPRKKEEGII